MTCTRKKQCSYGDICPTARSDEYNLIDASCYKPLEQTNEEWFNGLSTEEKAYFICDKLMNGACDKCKFMKTVDGRHTCWILDWLKAVHKE